MTSFYPSAPSLLSVATAFALLAGCPARPPPSQGGHGGTVGTVVPVTALPVSTAPRRDAREGDLTLHGTGRTALVFAAASDTPGHPPLRGAIVDVEAGAPDAAPDALGWWRFGWIDTAGALHVGPARAVAPSRCPNGGSGVTVTADLDGVTLDTTACATTGGRFVLSTRPRRPLPPGATLADEIHVGNTLVAVERVGTRWTPPVRTAFVAFSEGDVGVALECPGAVLARGDVGPDEISRSILVARLPGAVAVRTVHVVPGDALDAIALLPGSTRTVTLVGPAGDFTLRDPQGADILSGRLPAGGRTLRLPPDLGASAVFRDLHGIPARVPVAFNSPRVIAPPIDGGTLRLAFRDTTGHPLPVHVVLHGLDGTPDPTPEVQGRSFAGGRSVYLLDGTGDVGLAAGRYRVVATHGPRHGLYVRDLTVDSGSTVEVSEVLREVVPIPGRIAADFHLHAAPSPDSRVALDERVGSLVCEGVDFAVATDHNRVTDYGPVITALGLDARLASVPGEEVTTYTPFWGHFIAWPMAPGRAREAGVVPYFQTTPARIFADARARGAGVIQVNHPRLRPVMGYFDHVALDPATGHTAPTFATDFNAVEVFNGWSIEHPEDVRRSVEDLVALARRGMHPAATGNSDSHLLLYEEAGWPRTYVTVPPGTPDTLVARVAEGVRRGHTTVSAGPLVTLTAGSAVAGDTVRPDATGHLRVHVRVEAPAWVPVESVEVWLDDRVARRLPVGPAVDGVRFDGDVDLTVTADALVIAWADASTPLPDVLPYVHAMPLGFTGPLQVDYDGDGRVLVPPRR